MSVGRIMRRSQTAATEFQSKARIKVAAVVFSATGETRNRASHTSHTRKIAAATRASINKTRRISFCGEGEIVTAHFVADSEITASVTPFRAVRQDPPAAGTKLREHMCQFVTQRSIDVRAGLAANRNEIVITQ
jgi:hypothetical protein